MSRQIDVDSETGTITERVIKTGDCMHLCNDVCCNPRSDQLAELVAPEYCDGKCPQFERDDGTTADSEYCESCDLSRLYEI